MKKRKSIHADRDEYIIIEDAGDGDISIEIYSKGKCLDCIYFSEETAMKIRKDIKKAVIESKEEN